MFKNEKISFRLIGGENEIGSNCYYLHIHGTGIILDAGLHPEKKGLEALPNFELLENQNTDYVIISHSHIDHIGSLPYLIQRYPHLKIYTTPQSRDIAEVMLHNSLYISNKEIIDGDPLPHYTHEQLDLLTETINVVKFNECNELIGYRHLRNEQINLKFLDSGHILGSAGILLETSSIRIFYTGDTCASKQTIMAGAEYPEKPIDAMIMETTTAASGIITKRSDEIKRFAKSINKIVDAGGSILIPVFALGKQQEILALLHNLIKKGSIPELDIYTGGLGNEISDIYDSHRYTSRRTNNKLKLKEIPQLKLDYENLLNDKYFKVPSIVLAPSGMVFDGTPSFLLAQRWLKQKNFAIFFVGYLDPDSPGFKILHSKKNEVIKLTESAEEIKVMCEVDYFIFSSHSNREELINLVKITKPKILILVHGEPDGMIWIQTKVQEKLPNTKVIIPKLGEEYKISD